MQIRPEETDIVGRWALVDATIRADAISERIEGLTQTYLTKIAVSESGWDILYQDPADLRLWELTYPHGEMHGGGPPTLKMLSVAEAKYKYRY